MDDLEAKTRPLMEAARSRLAREKGASALEPHNIGHALAGDTTKLTDPYFPFEDAVDVWVRGVMVWGGGVGWVGGLGRGERGERTYLHAREDVSSGCVSV
jgi:hypothetical protein